MRSRLILMNCPVCQATNIEESIKFCPVCGYDISPYPLVLDRIPQAFIEKEQQRIAWAKKLWADCRAKIAQAKIAQAKIDRSETLNYQESDQFDKIVSQIKQLIQVQSQLSVQLTEFVSANKSARVSEIEQRLEAIASQLPSLSTTIEQQITHRLRESLSKEISTAVSQLEKRLDSIESVSSKREEAISISPITSIGIPLQTFSFEVVKVSDRGDIINRKNHQAQYFTENLGNSVNLDMVFIPEGTFIMGSPTTEKNRDEDEGPQHRVTVSSFFMLKYLVTQKQWQAIMGNNPSHFKEANRPVEEVSWYDAVEFCQKLSEKTGRDYRLPSEVEWEYACRAGTTTPFYFGETITTDLANYNGNYTYGKGLKGKYQKETTDVGIFPPNAFGLYDMHGNVWEWCADYWHKNYKHTPVDGSAWTSGGNSDKRLLRGGNWNNNPRNCRSARRGYVSPGFRNINIGFRIAVSLPITL